MPSVVNIIIIIIIIIIQTKYNRIQIVKNEQ